MKVKKKYPKVCIAFTLFQANRMESNGSKMDIRLSQINVVWASAGFALSNEYFRIIHIGILVFDSQA